MWFAVYMKLNLGAKLPGPSSAAAESAPAKSYHEEANEHSQLTLHLTFSNGLPPAALTASAGETLAQIKKRISDANGLSYGALTLTVEGKAAMDPFSLNDLKHIRGKSEVAVQIAVAQ